MKYTSLFFFILFVSCSSSEHIGHSGHGHHHRFTDAKRWAKVFENEKRELWQRPELVINRVGVKENSVVADIGSATGYFPVRLAAKAQKGRIWAIDIEPNLVNFLNKRVQEEKIPNIVSILGTPKDPMIPEKVDFIFTVDTYHHIGSRKKYFQNLKDKLKKNGKVVIVDFKKGDFPVGPKNPMKISQEDVIEEMKAAGFVLEKAHDFLIYQYILVFKNA